MIRVQVFFNRPHKSLANDRHLNHLKEPCSKARTHFRAQTLAQGSLQALGLPSSGLLEGAAEPTVLGEMLVGRASSRLIRVIEWIEMSTGKEKGRKVLHSRILRTVLSMLFLLTTSGFFMRQSNV